MKKLICWFFLIFLFWFEGCSLPTKEEGITEPEATEIFDVAILSPKGIFEIVFKPVPVDGYKMRIKAGVSLAGKIQEYNLKEISFKEKDTRSPMVGDCPGDGCLAFVVSVEEELKIVVREKLVYLVFNIATYNGAEEGSPSVRSIKLSNDFVVPFSL